MNCGKSFDHGCPDATNLKRASVSGEAGVRDYHAGGSIAREVDMESTGHNRPGKLNDNLGLGSRSGHPTNWPR